MMRSGVVLVALLASADVCAAAEYGDAQDMQPNTVYQATTSGLVVAGIGWNSGNQTYTAPLWGGLIGYTDANNPPATIRAAASCSARWIKISNIVLNSVTPYNSFTMPVKKGDFWAVATDGNSWGTIVVQWVPLL